MIRARLPEEIPEPYKHSLKITPTGYPLHPTWVWTEFGDAFLIARQQFNFVIAYSAKQISINSWEMNNEF
jgi:hypothetical protein